MSHAEIHLIANAKTFELVSPYNSKFVTELKYRLPRESRKWNPEKKVWVIDREQLSVTESMARDFYETVDIKLV